MSTVFRHDEALPRSASFDITDVSLPLPRPSCVRWPRNTCSLLELIVVVVQVLEEIYYGTRTVPVVRVPFKHRGSYR